MIAYCATESMYWITSFYINKDTLSLIWLDLGIGILEPHMIENGLR